MKNDPDVLVMGSKNGLGKTSVFEACSLLIIAALLGKEKFSKILHYIRSDFPVDLIDLIIKAGAKQAEIKGTFNIGGTEKKISLAILRDGSIEQSPASPQFKQLIDLQTKRFLESDTLLRSAEYFLLSLAGMVSEPLLFPPLLYFHSYRKVSEGHTEFGEMIDADLERSYSRQRRFRPKPTLSSFKREFLRLLMQHAQLFEDERTIDAKNALQVINNIMEDYAGGRVDKLKPLPNNTIEFRITPTDGKHSFTFDGLSSGQKEIISTLFLIWRYSQQNSCIVLIDEPELHLNIEWHRNFIRRLFELAPNNQYIIATHSEEIFDSVDPEHRALLKPD